MKTINSQKLKKVYKEQSDAYFMQLNERTSELIGAILGDGNIYNKRPTYFEIVGHIIEDKDYIENYLSGIIKEELNYLPKLSVRQYAVRIRVNNKKFVEWLLHLGLPTGAEKGISGLIPQEISKNKELVKKCIRGIVDTDGCVFFDKRAVYKIPYPRIVLHMENLKLLPQISELLFGLGFNPTMCKRHCHLYLNGFIEVQKFLSDIGLSNQKHLTRIQHFNPGLLKYNNAPVTQW